jgi:hypothetical protein
MFGVVNLTLLQAQEECKSFLQRPKNEKARWNTPTDLQKLA